MADRDRDRESRWTVAEKEKEQPKRPVRDYRNIEGRVIDVNRAPKAVPLEGSSAPTLSSRSPSMACAWRRPMPHPICPRPC
jgi:hypothetical protein